MKIRRKGYPLVSRTFDTKAQGERWAQDVEIEMDGGTYVDRSEAERTTLHEALERYEREVTPKKKGARQEKSRIAKWKRDALALRYLALVTLQGFFRQRRIRTALMFVAGSGGFGVYAIPPTKASFRLS